MARDRLIGLGLITASVVLPALIIYLLFFTDYGILTLKVITTAAILVLSGMVGWIGYTLATTPPPKPIEEIEKEIEEELKKLEQEAKKEEKSGGAS